MDEAVATLSVWDCVVAGDIFNVEMWKCGNMQVWKYGNGMGAESGNVIAALGFCVR